MVVGAFPIFKLGALILKQVSKPLANVVKARAKSNPFFRTYVCMPPAQFYHWCEVKMKMWSMNLGKPVNIPKLNENMAIELGAELLGEGVIFVTAAGILVFEYIRTSRKETAKEDARLEELSRIQSELKDLYFAKARQEAQIRELVRVIHTNMPSASIKITNFELDDIPEHHRQDAPEEESLSIFGTMKGLIWSAVDIILPPVNDSESLPTPPPTPQGRTTIVNDSPLYNQKTTLSTLPVRPTTSGASSNSKDSSSPNSKAGESSSSATATTSSLKSAIGTPTPGTENTRGSIK